MLPNQKRESKQQSHSSLRKKQTALWNHFKTLAHFFYHRVWKTLRKNDPSKPIVLGSGHQGGGFATRIGKKGFSGQKTN